MKVLCINSDWEAEKFWDRVGEFFFGKGDEPVFGEFYYVTEKDGPDYYYLAGFEDSYEAKWFIPVSDRDEIEIQKERINKKLYQ